MEKVFKLSDIRSLNKKVSLGEISSGKMIETLNFMAYEVYYKSKYKRKTNPLKAKKNEIGCYSCNIVFKSCNLKRHSKSKKHKKNVETKVSKMKIKNP